MGKTAETAADVAAFLEASAGPSRLADAHTLLQLMEQATGAPPVMWGPSIVGFGRYHYRYASGTEGDACLVGFSPRAAEFSIYLSCTYLEVSRLEAAALLARLGRHRIGKSCLYVRRLSEIDLTVLDSLVHLSVDALRKTYG